jgi:hypothetical protein
MYQVNKFKIEIRKFQTVRHSRIKYNLFHLDYLDYSLCYNIHLFDFDY